MELGENLRVIGKGPSLGNAETLIIEDADSGRRYLFFEFGFEAEVKKRILLSVIREIEARAEELATVFHPSLFKPLGVKRYGGKYYVVTDVCEGNSFPDYFAAATIDLKRSLSWMRTVAEIMAQYHAQDRVMFGPRADNILVLKDGGIALLDPKTCDILGQFRSSYPGKTENYLPPEVAKGAGWDKSSDLFAFGVLSYYMLSGKLPFDDEDPAQVTQKILEWEPWDVRIVNPEVSSSLAVLVMELISKDPARRPAAVSEVNSRLQVLESSGNIAAFPGERRIFEAKRNSIKYRRKFEGAMGFLRQRWAIIAGCIIGIVALVLLFKPTYVTPVITSETPAEDVVKLYYKSVDDLDIKALEEAIDRKAGRHILDLLTNIYILEQANKSLEFREAMFKTTKVKEAAEKMAQIDLVKVEGLKIAPLGSSGNNLRFKATYRLTMPSPQGPQVTDREDILTLARVGGRWKIVRLEERSRPSGQTTSGK